MFKYPLDLPIKQGSRILVCPLDWGLGHASRMIPVIKQLLKLKFQVIIAADNYPLQLLRLEFRKLEWLRFPSYQIKYSKGSSLVFKMLLSAPKIIAGIFSEHQMLKRIITSHQINAVISDNRFGLWNKNIYSVFVTHQLMIKMPRWLKFAEYPTHLINKLIINKYNCCWIPDNKVDSIAGDLTHKYKLPVNARFIGLLSRFTVNKHFNNTKQLNSNSKILVILSGPEPQRTIFENIIIKQLQRINSNSLIIRGKPKQSKIPNNHTKSIGNIQFINHMNSDDLKKQILLADLIICRSGYSSIMDLITLQKTAILVPTPGQTEQEYLAIYLMNKGLFHYFNQNKFKLINIDIKFNEIKINNQNIIN